jgi:hypothetical protein
MGYFIEPGHTRHDAGGIPQLLRLLISGAINVVLFLTGLAALVVPIMWTHSRGFHGALVYASGMLGVAVFVVLWIPAMRLLAKHGLNPNHEDARERPASRYDLITRYSEVLQSRRDDMLLVPESSLPAPKQDIAAVLIVAAYDAMQRGRTDEFETIRTSYTLLADFVPDAVAMRNRGIDNLNANDLRTSSVEMARLLKEFDSAVDAVREKQ